MMEPTRGRSFSAAEISDLEGGCVDGVGVLVHCFVRKMHSFSDESKADADLLLGDGMLTRANGITS